MRSGVGGGRHWKEPDEITKIAIGTFISALAPLTLAAISAGGHRVPLAWALPFHIINDLGFSNVFPVGLALYSRAAPKGLGGVMIAVYYLHLLIGNTVTGRIGALLDQVPTVQFWLIHVATIAARRRRTRVRESILRANAGTSLRSPGADVDQDSGVVAKTMAIPCSWWRMTRAAM
ncbi:MAG: hypothetical protein WDM89_16395 [Rhizomicrobium sp.]